MKIRTYLAIALLLFVLTVTGSDLFARMTIAGEGFGEAVAGHFDWARLAWVGLALLFAPFAGAALICGAANRRARTRSAATLFGLAMAALGFFYFGGFQAAQQALLDRQWTASALSVGLLPFLVGIPVLAVAAIAAAVVARLDRRSHILGQ